MEKTSSHMFSIPWTRKWLLWLGFDELIHDCSQNTSETQYSGSFSVYPRHIILIFVYTKLNRITIWEPEIFLCLIITVNNMHKENINIMDVSKWHCLQILLPPPHFEWKKSIWAKASTLCSLVIFLYPTTDWGSSENKTRMMRVSCHYS